MHTVVVEKEFPHPPEKVWRALTDPKLMSLWLMENDFVPGIGRKFSLRAKPVAHWNGVVDCEVLALEPCRRLAYSWNVGADGPAALRTVVTWTLWPSPAGTRVRMEHAGFRPDQKGNYQGAQFGWQAFFARLEPLLAQP